MASVALLGAGGPAGIGVARALGMGPHPPRIVGCDTAALPLGLAECDRCVLLPPAGAATRIEAWQRLAASEPGGLLPMPVADQEVEWVSDALPEAGPILPRSSILQLAADKSATSLAWVEANLCRWTCRVGHDQVVGADGALARIPASSYPIWLRASRGAGASRATRADTLEQALHWLRYWASRGPVPMMAEPYLPGRNIGVQMLFWNGECLGVAGFERLRYPFSGSSPSGITGTPSVARTIGDTDRAVGAALLAAEALGRRAGAPLHGPIAIDLKEDEKGLARPTECNAGRFLTTVGLIAESGRNFPRALAEIALGNWSPEYASTRLAAPWASGLYWLRHIDSLPVVVDETVLAEKLTTQKEALAR